MKKDQNIKELEIKAVSKNSAIAEAAIQLRLPQPWAQYWMGEKFKELINVTKIDSYTWIVEIDIIKIYEILNKEKK